MNGQQQYREVKRKARVGECVRVFGHCAAEANGEFMVNRIDTSAFIGSDTEIIKYNVDGLGEYGTPYNRGEAYVVLAPIDGRRARITNPGRRYSTYRTLANQIGFPDAAAQSDLADKRRRPEKGEVVTLLASATHPNGDTVWAVEAENGERHLYNVAGLEIIVPQESILDQSTQIDGILGTLAEVGRKLAQMDTQLRVTREDIALIEEGVHADIKRLEREIAELRRPAPVTKAEQPSRTERVPQLGDLVVIVDEYATNIGKGEGFSNGDSGYIAAIKGDDGFEYRVMIPETGAVRWSARSAFVFADDVATNKRQLTRADVIERARADIAELLASNITDVPVIGCEGCCTATYNRDELGDRVEFVVNREKRTVAALIHGNAGVGRIWARGIAKCAPGDVLNSHIGRAIALRRALGLEVPVEYVNAPQPTEPQVGDVVRNWEGAPKRLTGESSLKGNGTLPISYAVSCGYTVIDDSREEVAA